MLEGAATAAGYAAPETGAYDCEQIADLMEILVGHTRAADACWFAVWEGYGWLREGSAFVEFSGQSAHPADLQRELPRARVAIPERPMLLYTGPISSATAFCAPPLGQSPNLWWPDDRTWCVASEIDFHSTYVGGSVALIEQLLESTRVEGVSARVTDTVRD